MSQPNVPPAVAVSAISQSVTLVATIVALVAFAGNSLLCRLALRPGGIDPATFTGVRLVAGAIVLLAIVVARRKPAGGPMWGGSWAAAFALAAYAAGFSWAYRGMTAGTGALLLFGSVQTTMVVWAVARGERPRWTEWCGLTLALAGLAVLLAPRLAPPPPLNAAAMIVAGVAWGAYSLLGRGTTDPIGATAGNFLRAALLALPGFALGEMNFASIVAGDSAASRGVLLAIASGAVTSGIGYVIWYVALRGLSATRAALLQLSVPILAAIGGVALMGETVTTTLVASTLMVVGGVALAILSRGRR